MIARMMSVPAFCLALAPWPAPTALAAPYEEADWQAKPPGKLNISLYTFRDNNRNGEYDVGDPPLAGVVVNMTQPAGTVVPGQSNINGYANFKMSLNNEQYPVREPGGVYEFEVLAPPGWVISSGNPRQSARFLPLQGSVAGLYAEKPPHWVGLMPELAISGRVIGAGSAPLPGDVTVSFSGPGGEAVEVKPAANGNFSAPVAPGDWQVVLASAVRDWRLERTVQVTHAPVEMVTVRVGDVLPQAQPRAVLEHFDWLSRSVIDKLPNGHLGLNWDYLLAVHNQEYAGPGYVNGRTSGHAVAYNSSGHPVTISAPAGQVFDFVGGFFSVAWNNAHGEVLELEAFRDGERVARHETTLSYLGPVWLDAELRGIDRLVLTTRHYWQFVADDLKFRLAEK